MDRFSLYRFYDEEPYRLDPANGTRYYRSAQCELPVSLQSLSLSATAPQPAVASKPEFAVLLEEAALALHAGPSSEHLADVLAAPAGYGLPDDLRWFVSAGEVTGSIQARSQAAAKT